MACLDAWDNQKKMLGNQVLWSGCPMDNQDYLQHLSYIVIPLAQSIQRHVYLHNILEARKIELSSP